MKNKFFRDVKCSKTVKMRNSTQTLTLTPLGITHDFLYIGYFEFKVVIDTLLCTLSSYKVSCKFVTLPDIHKII